MIKRILLLLPLLLIVGCTNKVENEKVAYLEYKSKLTSVKEYSHNESIFNTFFNIERVNEELVKYSVVIKSDKNVKNLKALLIHDFNQTSPFPSVGILDTPVSIDSLSNIKLEGKIETNNDIANVNFKLYLEYTDESGNVIKEYKEVTRG